MSARFYQACKRAIIPVVKPLGFHSFNRYYYRITGGVVQQFCLLWLRRNFTIRFLLSSVYDDNDRTREGDDIYRLIDGTSTFLSMRPDKFCANPSALFPTGPLLPDYEQCALVCRTALEEYLLPFFEQTTTLESAYSQCEEKKLVWRHEVNGKKEPFSPSTLGFLLGMGQYSDAQLLLDFMIENHTGYNQRWWMAHQEIYVQLRNALEEKDTAFLTTYLRKKKEETYQAFKLKIK